MSLQVWLPLNGNLNNQGLIHTITTNNGATINNNGKIGQCCQFDGTNDSMSGDFTPGTIIPNEMSFCCWAKVSQINRANAIFCSRKSVGYGLLIHISSENKIRFDNGSNSTQSQQTFNYTIAANTWYHIALIQTNTSRKLYINGILQQTIDVASFNLGNNTATKYFIGATTANGTSANANYFSGYLNDIRIYDHALSDKEVQEIAKGLILHYKLDQPNSNLLRLLPRTYNAGSYNAYQLNMLENLVAGQTYTLQLWDVDVYHSAKTAAQTGVWFYWGGGSVQLFSWAGPTYFTQTDETNYHADYLVKTFTPTSSNASGSGATNAWFNVYNSVSNASGTRNMHIGAWKLEKGDIATPWNTPENNLIYDSSGYNNNGDLTNATIVNTTERFSYATALNGTTVDNSSNTKTGAAYLRGFITLTTPSVLTVAWWGKNDAYGRGGIFQTSVNADPSECTDYNTTAIANWDTTFRVYNGSTAVNFFSSFVKDGVWHHHAIVYDGAQARYYCDGIQKANSALTGTLPTFNGFCMGLGKAGGVYRQIKETVSDLRIYVTALTTEQILELYNTSASIDKEGNVYAREVIE